MPTDNIVVFAAACTTIAGAMFISNHVVHGQSWQTTPPAYDPYPPGILTSNIASEIARVQREINFIFDEAIGEWQALPQPNVQANPCLQIELVPSCFEKRPR